MAGGGSGGRGGRWWRGQLAAAAMAQPAGGSPPPSPPGGRAAPRRRPAGTPPPGRAPRTPRASLMPCGNEVLQRVPCPPRWRLLSALTSAGKWWGFFFSDEGVWATQRPLWRQQRPACQGLTEMPVRPEPWGRAAPVQPQTVHLSLKT